MVVSIVTGAGSGIGAATCRELAARGDHVLCADVDIAAAEKTAALLDYAMAVVTDVRDAQACERLIAIAVDGWGGLDNLVTCAGVEEHAPAHLLAEEAFDRVMDVNLKGTWLCARAAAQAMMSIGRGGQMVLVGSTNSLRAAPESAAYCASKGGVLMLGKVLAIDWAPYGIRVNVIGPGAVDTPMSARSLGDPVRRQKMMERVPLARPASASEIASVIAFLTSDSSSYMTGAFVPIDGGSLAR